MLMFDLPQDLIEEVFSRVPATTLIRLRTTCKLWNALFKNTSFTEKHFLKAPKQPLTIMVEEYRVCSLRVNLNVISPSIEFKDAPSLIHSRSNSEQVCILEVFHCDGLLLCITKEHRLVVWNPCLAETRWIQLKTAYDSYSQFALGYEDTKSCRNYKILRFWYCRNNKSRKNPASGFEIYEFRTDSWRVLEDHEYFSDYHIMPGNCSMSLKGNAYWHSFNKRVKHKLILCFDFTSERFKHLCFSTSVDQTCLNDGSIALSVVREEQLSMLQRIVDSRKLEIWVTNNIETATETTLSWTKSFTINDCCSFFSSFLIDEEKKVAMFCSVNYGTKTNSVCFIGENGMYYTETSHTFNPIEGSTPKSWWWPQILNYVPSLVQIQQIN